MTIAKAKELSRQTIGRLPKCGREVCVETGYRQLTLTNEWDGGKVSGHFEYRIYLANIAGRYRVWTWTEEGCRFLLQEAIRARGTLLLLE